MLENAHKSVPYMDLCKQTLKGLFPSKPFSTQDWINQSLGQALTSCNRDFVGGVYPPKLISVFFGNHPSRWQSSSHVQAVCPKALGIADPVRRGHWTQISSLSLRNQGWNMLAGPAKCFRWRTFNLGICGKGNLSTAQRSMEGWVRKPMAAMLVNTFPVSYAGHS